MTTLDSPRPVDYRELMKKVEQAVETIERSDEVGDTIHSVMSLIIRQFCEELGLYAGRIYRRRGDHFVLQRAFGEAKELPPGIRVPVTYEPVQVLLDEGLVYMDENDPRFDRDLERELGWRSSPPSRWGTTGCWP